MSRSMFLLNRTGRGNMMEKLVGQDRNGDTIYLLLSWAKQKINMLPIRIGWIVRNKNKIKTPSVCSNAKKVSRSLISFFKGI